jgi:membrane-associated phospholipid phosphatase
VAALLIVLGSAGNARAEDDVSADPQHPRGPPIVWNPAWPEFRTGEWITSGLGLGLFLLSHVLPQGTSHWRGGVLVDEQVRNTLRLSSPGARRWARDVSDIGITVNESWPFFDALVVSGWYRNSPHTGVQQALISAEVLSVTAGMQGLVSRFASRERPYGRDCGGALRADSRDCTTSDRYYSFYSGHSSQSFAAAAVNCMNHAYLPLYGGGAGDDWACVGTLGVATTTALLRIATDVHYLSDVVVGALLGSATGVLVPWALHYRHGAPVPAVSGNEWSLQIWPTPSGVTGVLVF